MSLADFFGSACSVDFWSVSSAAKFGVNFGRAFDFFFIFFVIVVINFTQNSEKRNEYHKQPDGKTRIIKDKEFHLSCVSERVKESVWYNFEQIEVN